MTRLTTIRFGILSLLLITHGAFLCAEPRPNIVLIMAEDLSPRIGAFGDPVAITPNIDALAAEGVRYTQAFATAGVCAPSRAAIITGMAQQSMGGQHMRAYNGPHGAYLAQPPGEVKAFPELLRKAGYYTFTSNKLDYQFSRSGLHSGPFTIWDREAMTLDRAELPDQSPFFAYLNLMSTHESGLFDRWAFPDSLSQGLLQLLHLYLHCNTEDVVKAEAVTVPPYYPDTPAVRAAIARHYNNIITMDRTVGRILQQLRDSELWDNTVVIWTTDHGDGFPRAKRELFDSGLHVPMVIRWPDRWAPAGARPGSIDRRLISLIDLAPTILTLADVPIPKYIQGRSIIAPSRQRQYIYAARDRIDELPDRQRAVRDARYKYIMNLSQQPGGMALAFRDKTPLMQALWQAKANGELNAVQRQWFETRPAEYLFDTQTDPNELTNLVNDPAHAATLERMRSAMADYRARVSDFSDLDESVQAKTAMPNGELPITDAVQYTASANGLVLSSDTKGASIGYRIQSGEWRLYSEPLRLQAGAKVEAKAVRYGWQESEVTVFTAKQ